MRNDPLSNLLEHGMIIALQAHGLAATDIGGNIDSEQ